MKINFKPVVDTSEQLNLRIPPALKQRIENLRTQTKKRGLDFNATLLDYIDEFVTESEKQLRICYESASKSVATAPASSSSVSSANGSGMGYAR